MTTQDCQGPWDRLTIEDIVAIMEDKKPSHRQHSLKPSIWLLIFLVEVLDPLVESESLARQSGSVFLQDIKNFTIRTMDIIIE